MFIIRDIFHLQFGHYKEVKKLMDEAYSSGLFPETSSTRVLTDFTGDAYRLALEQAYASLADYENAMGSSIGKDEWQAWYEKFKPHVISSHREIMKQVL